MSLKKKRQYKRQFTITLYNYPSTFKDLFLSYIFLFPLSCASKIYIFLQEKIIWKRKVVITNQNYQNLIATTLSINQIHEHIQVMPMGSTISYKLSQEHLCSICSSTFETLNSPRMEHSQRSQSLHEQARQHISSNKRFI